MIWEQEESSGVRERSRRREGGVRGKEEEEGGRGEGKE